MERGIHTLLVITQEGVLCVKFITRGVIKRALQAGLSATQPQPHITRGVIKRALQAKSSATQPQPRVLYFTCSTLSNLLAAYVHTCVEGNAKHQRYHLPVLYDKYSTGSAFDAPTQNTSSAVFVAKYLGNL